MGNGNEEGNKTEGYDNELGSSRESFIENVKEG